MSLRRAIAAIAGALALLTAHDVSAAQLTASWFDNSAGQAGFKLERRVSTDAAYGPLADVPMGITSYSDGSVSQGLSYCYRVKAYNASGESAYSDEACGSVPSDYSVSVTKTGNGSGTVTSTPSGINCGSGCTGSYPGGTLVTLTAAPAAGSTFGGWSGTCSGTGPCAVLGNSAVTVTATFSQVVLAAPVTAPAPAPAPVAAPAPAPAPAPTPVAAPTPPPPASAPAPAPAPAPAASAPTPAPTPTVTAPTPTPSTSTSTTSTSTSSTTTTASTPKTSTTSGPTPTIPLPIFAAIPPGQSSPPSQSSAAQSASVFILVVTKGGDGAGTVVSNPAGIQCGSGCVLTSPSGAPVSLAATPAAGSRFEGWAGACSGRGRCRLSGAGPIAVIARFSQVVANDFSVETRPSTPQTEVPVASSAIATPNPAPTSPRTAPQANTGSMSTRSWLSAVQNVTADIKSPYKLVVSVAKKTWVRIRMDNGQTYEEKLAAGAVRMWVTDRPFAISMGNAGGARLELNGRPLPSAEGVEISNVVLPQE